MLNLLSCDQVRSYGHEHLPVGVVGLCDNGPAQRVRLHTQAPRAAHGGEATEDPALGERAPWTTPHRTA